MATRAELARIGEFRGIAAALGAAFQVAAIAEAISSLEELTGRLTASLPLAEGTAHFFEGVEEMLQAAFRPMDELRLAAIRQGALVDALAKLLSLDPAERMQARAGLLTYHCHFDGAPGGEEEGKLQELCELLFRLFVNRADDYAIQRDTGAYVRANSEAGQRLRARLGLPGQLTPELIKKHLRGEITLGVYPYDPETGLAKWGCFDLDDVSPETVRRIYETIGEDPALKNACLVEQSSTRDRLHIWLFFRGEEPSIIRQVLRKIAEKADVDPRTIEIFPKQADISAEFGNLIRLPLGLHRRKKLWSVFIDPETGEELDPLEALRAIWPVEIDEETRRKIKAELRRSPPGGEPEGREFEEGWQPPEGLDLDYIEERILKGQAELIFCPALTRAITEKWKPGHRRPILTLIHATLRGLGFEDPARVKRILAKINEHFDPPLGRVEFETWFKNEWKRFGREFGPPGCKIIKHGGGALFAGLRELNLCEGCRERVPEWVKHPIQYTAWRVKKLTYKRVKLAELTARHIGEALEAYAMIGGVVASYKIPIGVEIRAKEKLPRDEKGILCDGIKHSFRPVEQVKFITLGERRQVKLAVEMALTKAYPELVRGLSDAELRRLLKKLDARIRWGTAVEAYALDVVDELKIDDKSITPRSVKIIILREPPLQTGKNYILHGTAGAIPPRSEIVFIATELEEERGEEEIDLEAVRAFCELGSAEEKAKLLERICGGVERYDMFMATALTQFSLLYVPFKGRPRLGVISTEIFGDTRAFKSEGVKRACRLLRGALYVSLETGGRTGLLYTISPVKGGQGYTIVWGELISADKKLIVIDGANKLQTEEWLEFRESRSDGCVRVRRAAKGDAWCRARLILIRNPERGEALEEFTFKIEALSTYQPPDIARLDIIVPVETSEERAKKVFQLEPPSREEIARYGRLFMEARKFIWSLRAEDIEITLEAIKAIKEESSKLLEEFACKRYPIVSADADYKLTKISCAFAALDGSFTIEPIKLIVRAEHVRRAAKWLAGVLRKADLHHYAMNERRRRKMRLEDLRRVILDVQDHEYASEILELIALEGVKRRSDIAAVMGLNESTISRGIKLLKKHRLIYSTSRGYKLTPRGNQVARAMFLEESRLFDVREALFGGEEVERHD